MNGSRMKIVVHPHELIIGGSPINAIDLAAKVRDLGHEVIMYAVRGPLETYVAAKGLRYVPAPRFRFRPALTHMVQLVRLAHQERIDLVHAYEWPPCLASFLGPGMIFGVPTVCTVLSMSVASVVPRIVPLIMGTEELTEAARKTHGAFVTTMEPPIDTDSDHPGQSGSEFRSRHRVASDQLLIVTVSRLAIDLKLDALVDAIDACDLLAEKWPVRLVIVGSGEAAAQLQARATAVNERHKREVVTLAGGTLDPRPAYAAADIVIGMGSSSLRGMAHGKPVVIQGEAGFNAPFDPEHEAIFLKQGFYGIGQGSSGAPQLAGHLGKLLRDPALRFELGTRGRQMVTQRYSLNAAASRLVDIYRNAIASGPSRGAMVAEAVRSLRGAAAIEFLNHLPSHKGKRAEFEQRKLLSAASFRGAAQSTSRS